MALLDIHMPDLGGLELVRAIHADPMISGVRLMIMTSMGRHGDAEEMRRLGIAGSVSKPVRPSELRRLLSSERALPASDESRQTVRDDLRLGCRILLVEDNPVNREVALGMLGIMGCGADLAANGREAIEAVARREYDLILMDCQMPEMDGFEATRKIREWEKKHKPTTTPIIALTAHALEGDRDACLASGMDDYLSKPFDQEQLRLVLGRWLGVECCASAPH
jgi:CheY-like chemotaxis protein